MRKITKGHYNSRHEGIEFDITNVKELAGVTKWAVNFIDYTIACDIYYNNDFKVYDTKKQALTMAKHLIEQYILCSIWVSECHGY